jgi:hypothetical protein
MRDVETYMKYEDVVDDVHHLPYDVLTTYQSVGKSLFQGSQR